jgi:hypothetical protein
MKKWMMVLTGMLLVGLGATGARAMHEPVESCDTRGATGIKVLATPTSHTTNVDLFGSHGKFAPEPLFSTSVKTSNQSCIIATFSALALPSDNWVVFQVLVDGQPMHGHMSSGEFFEDMGYSELATYVKPATPLVGDPEETNKNLFRMLSYTFFMPVTQGTHTIEVKWAGCCTALPTNLNTFEIGRATLLIHYK